MPQLVDQHGRTIPTARQRKTAKMRGELKQRIANLNAAYDAAVTSVDNERHWANADQLGAQAAARPEVRRKLRSRARYECHEANSYGKGIVLTLANDSIATGPRLQVLWDNTESRRQLEQEFAAWAREIDLGAKLRTLRIAKCVDGEAFAIRTTNWRLDHPVKLDLRLVEGDQVTSRHFMPPGPFEDDGIEYDSGGRPWQYHVMRHHPGDTQPWSMAHWESDPIDASHVAHLFRLDRPGQRRGIPEVTTALPLFAQMRRYTLAVIAAAETAAAMAGVIQTDAPADGTPEDIESLEAIPYELRALLTLPQGWKLGQIRPEQPTTTYQMFHAAILNEIARAVNMPYNVAAGNSSGYNFASGRLDHKVYWKSIDVERNSFELQLLDRLFGWWLEEAMFVPGLLPEGLPPFSRLRRRWFWPGHEHVDPAKEANAAKALWELGLLTDDEYLFSRGIDPDEHYQQLAAQMKRRTALGLPLPGGSDAAAAALDAAAKEDESEVAA